MKLIQTIIAFLALYVFVSTFVLLFVGMNWLRTFIPDSEKQAIANIEITQRGTTVGSGFTYNKVNAANALEVLVTRDISRATTDEEAVLAARSEILWAEYTKVTLPDALVPIGFRSMYKLVKISDVSGQTLYFHNDPLLSFLISINFIKDEEHDGSQTTIEKITLPLVASSDTITYTVTVDETGLHQEKNNEN